MGSMRNFFVAPYLGLAALISSCSFYLFQLLLLFVSPEGEGDGSKLNRIAADPLASTVCPELGTASPVLGPLALP